MQVCLDIRGARRTEKTIEVSDGETILSLLRSCSIHPDGVICFLDGVSVPLDAVVSAGQEITVVEAASGG